MKRIAAGLVFGFIIAILMSGCRSGSVPFIDFSRTVNIPPTDGSRSESEQRPLFVALVSILSPTETIGNYRQIAEYISRQAGRPVILIHRKTYAEVNRLMDNGDLDIAFFNTGAYCAYRGMNEIEILAMSEYRGSPQYNAYVIVHKESGIQSLDGLQGKVFAFTDPLSFSGHMSIVDYLYKQGTVPEKFFSRYFYTYSHDKSIWAVVSRIADGASLDNQMFEYVKEKEPDLVKDVRVIGTMGPAANGPVVISRKLKPEQKEQFRNIFLHMHEDPTVQVFLKKIMIDRYITPIPQLYDPLREMYDRTSGII